MIVCIASVPGRGARHFRQCGAPSGISAWHCSQIMGEVAARICRRWGRVSTYVRHCITDTGSQGIKSYIQCVNPTASGFRARNPPPGRRPPWLRARPARPCTSARAGSTRHACVAEPGGSVRQVLQGLIVISKQGHKRKGVLGGDRAGSRGSRVEATAALTGCRAPRLGPAAVHRPRCPRPSARPAANCPAWSGGVRSGGPCPERAAVPPVRSD
jgi:hypothetical protein